MYQTCSFRATIFQKYNYLIRHYAISGFGWTYLYTSKASRINQIGSIIWLVDEEDKVGSKKNPPLFSGAIKVDQSIFFSRHIFCPYHFWARILDVVKISITLKAP